MEQSGMYPENDGTTELTPAQLNAIWLSTRMASELTSQILPNPHLAQTVHDIILDPVIQSEDRLDSICSILGITRDTILPNKEFVFTDQRGGAVSVNYHLVQKFIENGIITQQEVDDRNYVVWANNARKASLVKLEKRMVVANEDLQLFMVETLNDPVNYVRSDHRKIKYERNYELIADQLVDIFGIRVRPTRKVIQNYIDKLPDEIKALIEFKQIEGPRSENFVPGKIEAVFLDIIADADNLNFPEENRIVQTLLQHLSDPTQNADEIYYGTMGILGIEEKEASNKSRGPTSSQHMGIVYDYLVGLGVTTYNQIYYWQAERRRYFVDRAIAKSRTRLQDGRVGNKLPWYVDQAFKSFSEVIDGELVVDQGFSDEVRGIFESKIRVREKVIRFLRLIGADIDFDVEGLTEDMVYERAKQIRTLILQYGIAGEAEMEAWRKIEKKTASEGNIKNTYILHEIVNRLVISEDLDLIRIEKILQTYDDPKLSQRQRVVKILELLEIKHPKGEGARYDGGSIRDYDALILRSLFENGYITSNQVESYVEIGEQRKEQRSEITRQGKWDKVRWYFESDEVLADIERYQRGEIGIKKLILELKERTSRDGKKRPGLRFYQKYLGIREP